jgi:molecular chaperone GrpE (heat shock protein)
MLNDLFNTIFNKSTESIKPMSEITIDNKSTNMVKKSELDEAMDDYRRLKNRFDKSVAEQSKATIKAFAIKIITIISDFESGGDIISQMVVNKLKALLETYNIVPMHVNVGDAFNVKYHNAVQQEENVAVTDDNTIMVVSSVLRDGYVMDGEVISYAMVSVKPWCRTENSTSMDETDKSNPPYMFCE